jgi:hypothetical protein
VLNWRSLLKSFSEKQEMSSFKKKIFLLSAGLVFALVILQACNSNPPTIAPQLTGVLPTFTSTPCSGIFGNTTIDSTVDSTLGTYVFLYPTQTNANKTLINLSMYSASAVPVTYEMGVYADSANSPSILLGQTGKQISGPITGWNTLSLSPSVPVSSYVNYWLAYHSTNILYQSAAASVTYALQSGVTAYGFMPATFTGTVTTSFVLSLYGTTCP